MGDKRASERRTEGEPAAAPGRRERLRSRLTRLQRSLHDGWHRLLTVDAAWMLLLVLIGGWVLVPEGLFRHPQVNVGEIATRDYTAPRDELLPEEDTTEELRQRAREAVLSVYDFNAAAAAGQDEQLARLFATGRLFLEDLAETLGDAELPEDEIEEGLLSALEAAASLRLSAEQARLLRARRFATDLEDRARILVRSVLRTGVVANKSLLLENRNRGVTLRNLETGEERTQLDLYAYRGHPDEVQRFLEVEVGRWAAWSRGERASMVSFLVNNLSPNVSLNLSETEARREQAVAAVEPVYRQIRRGQVIVRKGDTLGPFAVRVIDEVMGGARSAGQWLPWLGNLVLLCMISLALWHGIKRTRLAEGYIDEKTFGGLLLLLILSVLAAKLGLLMADALAESFEEAPFDSGRSYRYAIPFASLALVISLFYGRGAALLVSLCFSVLVARVFGDDQMSLAIYVLAGSLAASYALDRLKQRSAVTRAGLLVGLVGMATSLMLATFDQDTVRSASSYGFDLICALGGGLLVAAAVSFAVPVLESLLGVTTDIKLLELSDTNLPLLQRVAFEAPGTFQHSLMVANLAKAGSEAIGANAVLAYTGGLYHDIGKVFRPIYFVENQRDGENRHDRLAPSMSSLIVISHVKDGVELARAHRLPLPIIDAIEQHHGSRKLTFFYERARQQSRGEPVDEHKYRYPGPKPQNRVMGILMFADAVEAASRTLRDPSVMAIRSMLKRLLDAILQEDQLDETDLTLSDLRRVTEAFQRVLETIYHKRVDYPGYDFNRQAERPLRVVDGARPR